MTEPSTYEILSRFAQSWGLIFFVVGFAAVLVYALWPGKRNEFRHAASIPLRDEDSTPPSP